MKAEYLDQPRVTESGWYAVQNGHVVSRRFASKADAEAWIQGYGDGGPPPPTSPPPNSKPDDDDDHPEPEDDDDHPEP